MANESRAPGVFALAGHPQESLIRWLEQGWNTAASYIDQLPMEVANVVNAAVAEWQNYFYGSTTFEASVLNEWKSKLEKAWQVVQANLGNPVDMPPDGLQPKPPILVLPPVQVTGTVPKETYEQPAWWQLALIYGLPLLPGIGVALYKHRRRYRRR